MSVADVSLTFDGSQNLTTTTTQENGASSDCDLFCSTPNLFDDDNDIGDQSGGDDDDDDDDGRFPFSFVVDQTPSSNDALQSSTTNSGVASSSIWRRTPTPIPPVWIDFEDNDDDDVIVGSAMAPRRKNFTVVALSSSSSDDDDAAFNVDAAAVARPRDSPTFRRREWRRQPSVNYRGVVERPMVRTSSPAQAAPASMDRPTISTASAKRKRSTNRRAPPAVSRRRRSGRSRQPHSSRSVPDTDSDLELLSISTSVGDITLANIEQLEADEILARQLQSIYDGEMNNAPGNAAAAAATSATATATSVTSPRFRRSNNASAQRTPSRRGSGLLTSAEANRRRRGGWFRSERSVDESPIASRTRRGSTRGGAQPTQPRASDPMFADDPVELLAEFAFNPRHYVGGHFRPLQHAQRSSNNIPDHFLQEFFLDVDPFNENSMSTRRSNNNRRRNFLPLHPNLLDIIDNGDFEMMNSQLDFETILDVADRLGEAQTGLKNFEIEALTTEKMFVVHEEAEHKDSCSICMTEYETGENLTILPCLHNYHKSCVVRWLQTKPTCPICRVDVRR